MRKDSCFLLFNDTDSFCVAFRIASVGIVVESEIPGVSFDGKEEPMNVTYSIVDSTLHGDVILANGAKSIGQSSAAAGSSNAIGASVVNDMDLLIDSNAS